MTNEGCLQLAIAPVTLCHSTVAQVHQLCHGVHVTLTADAFQDLVEELRDHGGDKTNVEVKLGAGGCPRLGETLSAFGNMPSGGLIVVGLDEASDFDPVGVADPTAIEAGIASQARNSVVPPVQVTFDRVSTEGAVIVVARVNPLPLSQRPCRHQGNAYLRQADGDYRMSEPEVQQILALRDRPRFDAAAVPGTQLSDLDPDLTQAYVAAVRSSTRRLADASNEAVLRHRGVLVPQGPELTVAGLYALGAYPQQFAPSLAITAAVHLVGHLQHPVTQLQTEANVVFSRLWSEEPELLPHREQQGGQLTVAAAHIFVDCDVGATGQVDLHERRTTGQHGHVGFHDRSDDSRHRALGHLGQIGIQLLVHLAHVAVDQGQQQGVLVGEILIQRSHWHAGGCGDRSGGDRFHPIAHNDVRGSIEQCLHPKS